MLRHNCDCSAQLARHQAHLYQLINNFILSFQCPYFHHFIYDWYLEQATRNHYLASLPLPTYSNICNSSPLFRQLRISLLVDLAFWTASPKCRYCYSFSDRDNLGPWSGPHQEPYSLQMLDARICSYLVFRLAPSWKAVSTQIIRYLTPTNAYKTMVIACMSTHSSTKEFVRCITKDTRSLD